MSQSVIDDALVIAVPFIAKEEGCRLKPYRCAAGVPTIGYGRTGRDITMSHPPITKAQAEAWLWEDARRFAVAALKRCPGLADEPPYRLAAVTSFAFNLGTAAFAGSTLAKRIEAEDWDGAAEQFGRWVRAGGKVLQGLVNRRAREARLFRGEAV